MATKRKFGDPEDDAEREPRTDAEGGKKRRKVSSKRLDVDALPWKAVDLPDKLDDWEGFFGLEEVKDVRVVRDAESGRVSIQPKGTIAAKNVQVTDDESEEEFSGFSDRDEPVQQSSVRQPMLAKSDSKPTKAGKFKEKRPKETANGRQGTAFEALEDQQEDGVDVSAWRKLNLSSDLLSSLSRLKFAKPTPIQSSAIPEVFAGHDVIGKASTGSGKTLAFGIPILEEFLDRQRKRASKAQKVAPKKAPIALILSPTRELAHQLDKHLTALCSRGTFDGPSIATITGGLAIEKQERQVQYADIIIGTPGRLWQVISGNEGVMKSLPSIQFLVVDEADRLLSEGHFEEVEKILDALERKDTDEDVDEQPDSQTQNEESSTNVDRQTLVFSATFDRSLQRRLASKTRLRNDSETDKQSLGYLLTKLKFREAKPKFVDVNPDNQLATGLKEGIIECSSTEKDLYLYTLLVLRARARTLVFTNSVSAVQRLTPLLQNLNLPVMSLYSEMKQKNRLQALERFSDANANGKNPASILIASDVAARGLDIPSVDLVIHYHFPRQADTYIHRSGRTARAGQPGSSIIICSPEEATQVRRLIATVRASSAGAVAEADTAKRQGYYIRTLDLDRRIVTRLRPRVTLAKEIADTQLAKTKHSKEDAMMQAWAEELGVEYDSDEEAKGKRGRGAGRKKKEKELKALSKGEIAGMKAELRQLLAKRVNLGVSEKYLTSGGVDVEELLADDGGSEGIGGRFLGRVQGLEM